MLSLIIKGLLLGLGAAVPIGPINVEIARRTLRAGFRAGVAIGAGAVTVDMTYAIVASLGMRPLLTFKPLAYTITIAGIALLTFLGLASIAAARRAATHDPLTDAGSVPSVRRGYITGLFMTALN